MIRYKIRDVGYECDEEQGTAKVITPDTEKTFSNAIEAWNYFTGLSFYPLEKALRDELEKNGFNRWTGERKSYTESEMKMLDDIAAAREKHHDI